MSAEVTEPRNRKSQQQGRLDSPGGVPAKQGHSPKQRSVFVIAPIGADGSETRKRSDQILKHIIEPVVTRAGFDTPLRADKISESGRITRQIIEHIVTDELVIADLTDSNPNVYYELALRHAVKKPFVQILAGGGSLPFDVADQRTIMVDHRDLDSVAAAKEEMQRQVVALSRPNAEVDTPLTFALEVATLRGSEDPGDRTQAEILDMLQEVRAMSSITMSQLRQSSRNDDVEAFRTFVEHMVMRGFATPGDIEGLAAHLTRKSEIEWAYSLINRATNYRTTKSAKTNILNLTHGGSQSDVPQEG